MIELTPERKKAMVDLIDALLLELDPPCIYNVTVDLINMMHGLSLVSTESVDKVEADFQEYTDDEKRLLWSFLQTPGALIVEKERRNQVMLAVLQCMLATLFSHRTTCQSMNPDRVDDDPKDDDKIVDLNNFRKAKP